MTCPTFRHAQQAAAALALAVCCAGAQGQASPWYVGASQTVGHETNLLRLGDGQAVPAGRSKSDSVSSTALLGGFDQPFGRQRGYGNVSVRSNRYARNEIFDNTSYAGVVGLDWATVGRVSGALTASVNRGLANFDYNAASTQGRDLETTSALSAAVRVGVVTEYTFDASLAHRRSRHSLTSGKPADFDQDTATAGVRWMPRASTTLGAGLRQSKGRYPNFRLVTPGLPADGYSADRFTENAVDFSGTLQPTGASTVDARLSYSRTRYDLNFERDFSGLTGSLGWIWTPTGKLRMTTRVNRDTGQNSYAFSPLPNVPGTSDYSQVTNAVRVQGDYAATGKTAVTAALQFSRRQIVNVVQNPFLPSNASGRDSSTLLALGGRWMPLRTVTVGCDLSAERRTARNDQPAAVTSPLSNNAVSCFGQLQLQS